MVIQNKKADFKYIILEKFEAGISLNGMEVKALRNGLADLTQSYIKIIDKELYLINTSISISDPEKSNPTRMRKLLMHRKEIVAIETKLTAKKLAIVPIKLYNKGRNFKLEIALAKGKKDFEKRESIKNADIKRDIARELRGPKDNDSRV